MKTRQGARFATIVAAAWLALVAAPVSSRGANSPQGFGSSNLWLQLKGFTNDTASLVIHRPLNDTNVTHDLFFTPSLSEPVQWQFEMRCLSTNVNLRNLCGTGGYFMLRQTNGSLTVDADVTPQALAQMLLPAGLTPMNVIYTGTNRARGTFSGGNGCGLPLDSGVILATGDITNAIGPNNLSGATTEFGIGGDTDLSRLVGRGTTLDAAVLEFDVVTTNDTTLGFEYIFASEEYPEWIGAFNDPMAIFVNTNRLGTNWVNTNNIALVPGTTLAVSVNSVNGGCSYSANGSVLAPSNPQFYADNHDPIYSAMPPNGAPQPIFNIQYDGMTTMLTAQMAIAANVTNHVKIAIADYGDDLYDSAVFIRSWCPCH